MHTQEPAASVGRNGLALADGLRATTAASVLRQQLGTAVTEHYNAVSEKRWSDAARYSDLAESLQNAISCGGRLRGTVDRVTR